MAYQLPQSRSARRSSLGSAVGAEVYDLLLMWKHPRMVAWFVLVNTALFLVRLPFARIQIIPTFLELHPGFVFIPLTAMWWGPSAAWAALTASLMGDVVLGTWGQLSLARALGYFLAARTAQVLWKDAKPEPERTWLPVKLLVAGLPSCAIAALWPAWIAACLRLYPCAYFSALGVLNNLIFWGVLASALSVVMTRVWGHEFGTWQEALGGGFEPRSTRRAGRVLIWAGSCGGLLGGLLVSGMVYATWPLSSYPLGSVAGLWVTVVVGLGLLVHVVGLFWPGQSPKQEHADAESNPFRTMYLPPLQP